MAWTYDGTLDTDAEKVRFRIGDTDTNDQQLTDAEITLLLTENTTVYKASIAACYRLAAKYARQVTSSNVGASWSASDRHKHYIELAEQIRKESARKSMTKATIFVGGLSIADDATMRSDSDVPQPKFSVDQDSITGQSGVEDSDKH